MSRARNEGWLELATAPRDGSTIQVTALEANGEPFEIHTMQWSHIAKNEVFAPGMIGMWIHPSGSYTWREGDGGPTHWRPSL